MKILINGYTVTEQIQLVRTRKDLDLVNRMIDHIKSNKVMYLKLVYVTAILLHLDILVYAGDFATSIDRVGNQILDMLMIVAKWGSISMGVKTMITTILSGGNIRQATMEGIQYFIGFLFIQFYPQLFDMFKGIKF